MARPRRVSDDDILHAVRRAVVEVGPHVSLDVVAERLGVTAPALFRRFRSRHDLLIAALRPDAEPPFLAHIEAGPDDRPVEVQLVDLFTRIGSVLAEMLPCVSALRESGIALGEVWREDPPPLRTVRALAGWLERARARRLVAVADPAATATAMLGALQAPIFLRHLAKQFGSYDASVFARALAELLLRGVAPEPRARASQKGPKERS
jgi:AcrR family transcriptional regulator